jgi:hypothetical protein
MLCLLFGVEAREHFLTLHFLFAFQVRDGFIDGLNQFAGAAQVFPEDFPVRFERPQLFEIGPAQDAFDLLQLETQFPVKQDLLQG